MNTITFLLPIIEFNEVHNTQNDKSSLYIYTCETYKAWFWSEAAFTNMTKSVIFLRKKQKIRARLGNWIWKTLKTS